MKFTVCWILLIVLFALCPNSPNPTAAQIQNSMPASSDVKRGEIQHRIQLQLLIASNIVTAKTDYPASLENVVKQLKSSLSFKNHYLVTTYFYNVADGGTLEVSDATYHSFERGGSLQPTFFNLGVSGIKLNTNSIHILKFKFEERRRIFMYVVPSEEGDSKTKPVSDYITTGITTELNLKEGIPTIVGTTTRALSHGVLVPVITVNHSEIR
jgi:hypothetical protein